MNFSLYLSFRYLLSNQKGSFTRFAGILSLTGLAVGVSSLLLTLFILNGFERVISQKIAEFDGHIRIRHFLNQPISSNFLDSDSTVINFGKKFIKSSFIQGPALLRKGDLAEGVIVEGIDNDRSAFLKKIIINEKIILGNKSVIIGKQLADKLNLFIGDKIVLFDLAKINTSKKRIRQYTITGLFHSGMTEYDKSIVFVNLNEANTLFDMDNLISGVIINLNDISELEHITSSFNNSLSYPHMVMTWKEKNQALFSWLNIQRWPILFIFGLIALVGIVNIISSLAMIIIDKSRQIGILKSLGMKKSQLKLTFLIQGLIIGIIGSLIGSVISLIIAWLQNSYKIIQVPEDIYFMDFIPIDINFSHILFISLLAIFFSIFAAIWPSIKIDKIKSSEALKYE